jgi:predicted transporter
LLELLWQLGILSTVLIFGIKIGLAIGFAGLSKKVGVIIAASYGIGTLVLASIISGYANLLYKVVYDYNFVLFSLMALIISYAGLITIREWKVHHKNHAKATCAAMIAPCPCCFGAVVVAIVLISPIIGVSSATIGQYAALLLSLTIVVFYFASGAIVRIVKKPYPILLGNFMLFAGFYFLASTILLPNINAVIQSPMRPTNINSVTTLSYVAILVVILIVIGFYRTKKQYNRG